MVDIPEDDRADHPLASNTGTELFLKLWDNMNAQQESLDKSVNDYRQRTYSNYRNATEEAIETLDLALDYIAPRSNAGRLVRKALTALAKAHYEGTYGPMRDWYESSRQR